MQNPNTDNLSTESIQDCENMDTCGSDTFKDTSKIKTETTEAEIQYCPANETDSICTQVGCVEEEVYSNEVDPKTESVSVQIFVQQPCLFSPAVKQEPSEVGTFRWLINIKISYYYQLGQTDSKLYNGFFFCSWWTMILYSMDNC